MENKLIPFTNQKYKINVIQIDGENWFVAKEICNILCLTNVSEALNRLDINEYKIIKGKANIQRLFNSNDDPSMKNITKLAIINESGLYNLIFESKKKEAKEFKKWVTSEVLPTIRKTGGYNIAPTLPSTNTLDILELSIRQMREHQNILDKQQKQLNVIENNIEVQTEIFDKKLERLEDCINNDDGYFRVVAYGINHNVSLPLEKASQIGKIASRISKRKKVFIGLTADGKYGHVNTYHKDILKLAFEEYSKENDNQNKLPFSN
jgi:prophage antirepressor-like protein